MSPVELLSTIHHEVELAKVLTDALVAAEHSQNVVTTAECRPCIEELTRRLRDATCAATALRSLAVGNEAPRQGDGR